MQEWVGQMRRQGQVRKRLTIPVLGKVRLGVWARGSRSQWRKEMNLRESLDWDGEWKEQKPRGFEALLHPVIHRKCQESEGKQVGAAPSVELHRGAPSPAHGAGAAVPHFPHWSPALQLRCTQGRSGPWGCTGQGQADRHILLLASSHHIHRLSGKADRDRSAPLNVRICDWGILN